MRNCASIALLAISYDNSLSLQYYKKSLSQITFSESANVSTGAHVIFFHPDISETAELTSLWRMYGVVSWSWS